MKSLRALFVFMWVSRWFSSIEDLTKFMNTLNPVLARDTKIVCVSVPERKVGEDGYTQSFVLVYLALRP